MRVANKRSGTGPSGRLSTAEAFYQVFQALPAKERVMAACYILTDEDIRRRIDLLEFPNETTLQAFAEERAAMPVFRTVDDLRKDLLS